MNQILKTIASIVACFCFFHFALKLSYWFQSAEIEREYVHKRVLFVLKEWEVVGWYRCERPQIVDVLYKHEFRGCQKGETEEHAITLPLNGIRPPRDMNVVHIRPKKERLGDLKGTRLGWSRFFHKQMSIRRGNQIEVIPGPLADGLLSLPRMGADLNELTWVIWFEEGQIFGPLDREMVVGHEPFVSEWLSFPSRMMGAASLSMVFELGMALVINLMGWIFSINPFLTLLGVIGGLRAFKQYTSYAVMSGYWLWSPSIQILYTMTLIALALIQIGIIHTFYSSKTIKKGIIGVSILNGCGCLIGRFIQEEPVKTFDLMVDGLSGLLGLGLLIPWFFIQMPRVHDVQQKRAWIFTLLWWLGAYLFMGWTNLKEWIEVDTVERSPLNWMHTSYLPLTLLGALTSTGTFETIIKRITSQIQQWVENERDLKEAKIYYERNLPPLKQEQEQVRWRIGFFPSRTLGGDWCDVRLIPHEHPLLVAGCLVDLTGHGLPAALNASVMQSQWLLWSKRTEQLITQSSETQKHDLPWQIIWEDLIYQSDQAFSVISKKDSCTGIFFLYNILSRDLSIISMAHPSAMIVYPDQQMALTEKVNPFPIGNGFHTQGLDFEVHPHLPGNTCLFFISDGVCPHDQNLSRWYLKIQKQFAKTGQLEHLLYQNIRFNRRRLRNPAEAHDVDDATILKIQFK